MDATELKPELKTKGGATLSLREGVYTNMPTTTKPHPDNVEPRWLPDHSEPLWHPQLGQEVRIVGIQETAGVIQYQIRILNSSDTTVKLATEKQLQPLNEAERVPEDGQIPVNKAPWAAIKTMMLDFLSSYPLDAEKRSHLEQQVKSRNKGLAQAIVDERTSETGVFSGEANLVERMNMRNPGFPWDAIAPLFDYSLPHR